MLTLVPTPIDEENPLEACAHALLLSAATENIQNSIFAIEDLRPGRRRWLRWKLPRESVDNFVLYNEHTWKEESEKLIRELKKGKDVFLMSDGGLPAFCDPGRMLVRRCHEEKIKVTSTPFPNSISLAISLSGLEHEQFIFRGFLPLKGEERENAWNEVITLEQTTIIMDTPYRMKRVIEELCDLMRRENLHIKAFLGMDLNSKDELLLWGNPLKFKDKITNWKREFILVISK